MWKGETCLLSFTLRETPRYATGLAAMVLSVRFMYQADSLPLLFASIFLFIACATDTFISQIPNPLNLTLLLAGFFYHGSTTGTTGVLTAFLGMLLGFALLIVPHLLGGMGAGDVKALAALGALMGPWGILHTFIYIGLAGGIMAILHYAFTHNLKQKFLQGLYALKVFSYTNDIRNIKPSCDERLRFPYAAAIAFGFFAYIHWGRLL